MSWFYAENGAQKGPVNDDEFQGLVRAGAIQAGTLVWREGMSDWQPYAQVATPGSAVPGAPPPLAGAPLVPVEAARCAECGGTYARKDMVAYGEKFVCAGCRDVFFQKVREGVITSTTAATLTYAGFWIRLGAFVIDSIALGVVGSIVNVPLTLLMMPSLEAPGRTGEFPVAFLLFYAAMMIFSFALQIGYRVFFVGRFGATPGKMALSLRIVRPDGGRLTYKRAFGRAGAEIVSGLTMYIGYIMAGFDDEKRALHDRICDTRVIRAS